jgi:hypothetical protein
MYSWKKMRVFEYLSIQSGSQKEEENMLMEKGDSLNVISKETENILVMQMIEWKYSGRRWRIHSWKKTRERNFSERRRRMYPWKKLRVFRR